MDQDEDQNDGVGNPRTDSKKKNQETGETEHCTFHQYRDNEQVTSDDDESVSVGNVSSDNSSDDEEMHNTDHAMNKPSFSEHLNSIPGFYDYNEKISSLLDFNRQNEQQENELATKLNEIKLNDESSKRATSPENDSEKLDLSRDIINVSDSSVSRKNKRYPFEKSRSSNPILSDYFTKNSESSVEEAGMSSVTPQASTSQHSNFRSNFFNAESSDWFSFRSPDPGTYRMIPSHISSTCINLENSPSSQAHANSNTSHRTDTPMLECNSQSTSFDRVPNSPSTSFDNPFDRLPNSPSTSFDNPFDKLPNSPSTSFDNPFDKLPNSPSTSFDNPFDILLRNVKHCYSDTSSHNIHSTQERQRLNTSFSSTRNVGDTSATFSKMVSEIFQKERSRSCEKPSTSSHDIVSRKEQYPNASTSSASEITKKNESSLPDLLSTSKISPQRSPPRFSQYPTNTKAARKLNFDDTDSSDDSKKKLRSGKVNVVRKFSETKEPRKKRKTRHKLESSESHLTLPNTNKDENISENTHLSLSSEKSEEKSSKPKERESASSELVSSETMNSEISEAHSSYRKRLISDAKASDSDESDVKSKQKKKLKQSDASDK